MSQAPATALTDEDRARLAQLADVVRALDPGTRALLDLSVRRGVRDDAMAPMLHTDPFHLAWRRARALEQVATDAGAGELPLARVRAAIGALPDDAFIERPALPQATAQATGTALVPVARGELDASRPRRIASALVRLDEFASSAPTLRTAVRDLARAVARKAVRTVVWRARS